MKLIFILHLLSFLPPSTEPLHTLNDSVLPKTQENCAGTVPFVAGRNATFSLFDGENRTVGKMVYQYDRTVEGNYRVDKYDNYGRLRRSANGKMDCSASVSNLDWTPKLLDLLAVYMDKEVKMGENQLAYPTNLNVGDALPDGAVTITIADKGRSLVQVNMRASERRVEGMEQIRAGGNVYDAFKVTYLQTVTTIINNQTCVPVVLRQTEWIAPNVGIVKTATFHNTTGKMLYGSLLNMIVNDIPPAEPVVQPAIEANSDKVIMELPTDLPSIKPE
jgi:hypothetical protein